jgi:hypothetical protein
MMSTGDEDAVLHRWLEKAPYEAKPLHFALARLFGFVGVRVTDENDRFDQ